MIALVWVLNFVISWFNAWGCGRTWNETKYAGGFAHFMNWMGAVMSACGFTWCYSVFLAFIGGIIKIENADKVSVPILSPEQVDGVLALGYLVVIFPIIGSGLVITLQAWKQFWERKTLGNGAVTAWDTFAMVYNISSAMHDVPIATSMVSKLFEGKKDKNWIVLALIIAAAFGGILTTYTILTSTARNAALNAGFKHRMYAR